MTVLLSLGCLSSKALAGSASFHIFIFTFKIHSPDGTLLQPEEISQRLSTVPNEKAAMHSGFEDSMQQL